MGLAYGVYDLTLRALRGLSPPLGLWDGWKVGRGIRGRLVSSVALREWSETYRDQDRPLVWFHAPSVGESLQAGAVMEALCAEEPEVQLVYTFFSPSAEGMLRKLPVHAGGYLPWDTRPEMEGLVDALRPDVLVFTKTEVWPVLAQVASEQEVPAVLVAGTLPSGASRLRWPARAFLQPAFRTLRRVCAISQEDGDRFRRLGVSPEVVEVTGDPGIDSAAARSEAADPGSAHLRPLLRDRPPTLVAGSTWKPDERILLPALRVLRREVEGLRLVIAPHEPTPGHLSQLTGELEEDGWSVIPLSRVESSESVGGGDVVVVDRVGVLSDLYRAGDVAFVGGGFHDHGLHSVLEPAAAGLPVTFGPRHQNARAAAELEAEGGARAVGSSEELAEVLGRWLKVSEVGEEAASRARGYIERHRGAAVRTSRILKGLLGPEGEERAPSAVDGVPPSPNIPPPETSP